MLTRIALDDDRAARCWPGRSCTVGTVPAAGRQVWLRDNANLSTGGTGRDVTDRIHPDVARLCLRVAALVGLDIAGIDLRLPDIAAPVPPTGDPDAVTGGVIEVNAVPGLRMHLAPVQGRARDVGDAIVRAMFPGGLRRADPDRRRDRHQRQDLGGADDRVPAGRRPGCGSGWPRTDGVSIDGRTVYRGRRHRPALGADGARRPGGAGRGAGDRPGRHRCAAGLGYDRTDVGVVTNITADHLGQDGLDSIEDIAHVKALVAERVRDGGTLVLNADDPWVRSLADRPRVRADRKRIVWFGTDPRQPVVAAHLGRGGTAYVLQDGWLVQATGGRRTRLLRVAEVPGAFGGAATYAAVNALAAIAAARALGASQEVVVERLADFEPRVQNPGRGTLLRLGDVTLFVDYAHNPAALAAVLRTLHRALGPGALRRRGDAARRPPRRPARRLGAGPRGRGRPGGALRRRGPAWPGAGRGVGAGRAGDAGPPPEAARGPGRRLPGGGRGGAAAGRAR